MNNDGNNSDKTNYLNCKLCNEKFNLNDVGIVTDHGQPQVLILFF